MEVVDEDLTKGEPEAEFGVVLRPRLEGRGMCRDFW